jgi:glucose/arabinose dehydrogenase/plastocyanin
MVALVAIIGAGGSLFSAIAQDATPAASDVAPATPGGTLPGDPSIQLVQVATELADPVNVTHAGDGSGRTFVVERIGRVRIVDQDQNLVETPFLDIQNSVKTDFLEQGLLGLAFHPNYRDNGLFYVYYSDYATNGNLHIVQYNVSADDPNVADPESAKLVLSIPGDPFVNHNGGTIAFGPDGYLYFAIGDGGLAGDPYDNAQNIRNYFGKIHRIDVTDAGQSAYQIPEDNPFAQGSQVAPNAFAVEDPANYHPGAQAEIWGYGLRNPWRFSFDQQTGDLYLPDVGQNAVEEINFQEAGTPGGQNYGWDWLEGSHCYPETVTDCARGQVGVLPVAEYDHSQGDCSITGLGVNRSEESAELDGMYFASDFCSGRIWGLERDDAGAWMFQELLDTELLVTGGGNDEAGAVYLTSCNCEFDRAYNPLADSHGILWRVVQSDQVPEGAVTVDTAGTPSPATPVGDGEADAADSTPDASPAASTASAAPITIEAVDIDWNPNEATIAANTDVTITVPNNGVAFHTFVIEDLGIKVEIEPGQTQEVVVNAPAGTYEFICDVPGHAEAGMVGTLIVE